MKFSNRTYDILKYIAQIVLPALATLYATLGKLWGLPFVTEIPATIMALDFFLGTLLKISTDAYNKEVHDGNSEGNNSDNNPDVF